MQLGLAADLCLRVSECGERQTAAAFPPGADGTRRDFGGKFVTRLLNYCTGEVQSAVTALAAARGFDRALYFALGDRLRFNPSAADFATLTGFSFVWRDPARPDHRMTAKMPSSIQDKFASIIAEIDRTGHADVLRLTVLKKWFEQPRRRRAFGLWVAERAAARGDAATGEAGELFALARAVLLELPPAGTRPGWTETERLYRRLRAFQDDFTRQQWGPVRIIRNHDLLLMEEGLALYLGLRTAPTDAYRLAVEDCAHYDGRYGRDLNGPSRDKLLALVGFVTTREAREDAATAGTVAPRQGSTG